MIGTVILFLIFLIPSIWVVITAVRGIKITSKKQ